jgi:two-component system, NtrC family, sensor kinase
VDKASDAVSPQRLRRRIITIVLMASLLPLCLMGAGVWVVFGGIIESKALEVQRSVVERHALGIRSYLEGRFLCLKLLADNASLAELCEPGRLDRALSALNETTSGGFVDLGIIGLDGEHLAYVGPFDLEHLNYRDADWFKSVLAEGEHLSDVFLGFRQVPHCIVAVKAGSGGGESFILRATINSRQFDEIVTTAALGKRGDAYILNREGRLQTTSKTGLPLQPSSLAPAAFHRGTVDRRIEVDGEEKIRMTVWLNRDRWALVVDQDAAEVRAPVRQAFASGAIIMALSVLILAITIFLSTFHLTNRIDRANAAREEMFRAFMRSAKLASVGELATGLAHEINNPLAIVSAEQTNIADLAGDLPPERPEVKDLLASTRRIRHQVERCASITGKMLQFGRKGESMPKPSDVGPRLREIASLLHRQSTVRNIDLSLEIEDDLPLVVLDPLELEQVLVNLINNAFHAMPTGGRVRLRARRADSEVRLDVEDTGTGIPGECLDRIFEPFFTTKPVGEGTGLGLSICYGIVKSWGGSLDVESKPGQGTCMRIHLPAVPGKRKRGTNERSSRTDHAAPRG